MKMWKKLCREAAENDALAGYIWRGQDELASRIYPKKTRHGGSPALGPVHCGRSPGRFGLIAGLLPPGQGSRPPLHPPLQDVLFRYEDVHGLSWKYGKGFPWEREKGKRKWPEICAVEVFWMKCRGSRAGNVCLFVYMGTLWRKEDPYTMGVGGHQRFYGKQGDRLLTGLIVFLGLWTKKWVQLVLENCSPFSSIFLLRFVLGLTAGLLGRQKPDIIEAQLLTSVQFQYSCFESGSDRIFPPSLPWYLLGLSYFSFVI